MLFNEEGQNLSNDDQLEDNHTDDDTTTEGDDAPEVEGEESDTVTLTKAELEQRLAERAKEQDKRWKDRIKGLKGDEEGEDDPKPSKQDKEVDNALLERLDRSDLRAEGIKDKAEQDIVLKYAKLEGLDAVDALDSPIVKAALKTHRDKASTPSPTKRTAQGTRDEVAYWADQTLKGKRAPTAEMRSKVLKYLSDNKR